MYFQILPLNIFGFLHISILVQSTHENGLIYYLGSVQSQLIPLVKMRVKNSNEDQGENFSLNFFFIYLP
jgi:hypothetical protein